MDEEVGLGHAVLADGHDLGMEPRAGGCPCRDLPKIIGCASSIAEHLVFAQNRGCRTAPRPVVEDVAVLEDLDEGAALVAAGRFERRLHVFRVWVSTERAIGLTPRPPGRPSAAGWGCRSSRPVSTWSACRIRGRRCLALGQPVDPVVEHDQDRSTFHASSGSGGCHDRQRAAIAGDDPDHEVGSRGLEAGRRAGARPWIVWNPNVFM